MNTRIGREYQIVQQANIDAAVNTALSVTNTTLTNFGNRLGVGTGAAGAISSLIKILWKQRKQQTQWQQFMAAVENLVDQKITALVYADAIANLEGVENNLEIYQAAAQNWNNNPNSASAQERVWSTFRTTNAIIEGALPSFRKLGYETPLLTVYAQAANLHLLLLQDAVNFGEAWGMDSAENEFYYSRLQGKTGEYTDHCVNTYHRGLNEAKKLIGKLNPSDFNKYPYLYPYADGTSSTNYYKGQGHYYGQVLDWNVMNDYRRSVTLMVLDVVSIWPTYDPRQYSNPNGVSIQLSREVYSTAYGKVGRKAENWEFIENRFVRPPHLVTWLSNLAIRMSDRPSPEDMMQFVGVKNRLSYIGSSTTWEEGFNNNSHAKGDQNVRADLVGGLRAVAGPVPCSWQFLDFFGNQFQTVGRCPQAKPGTVFSHIYTLNDSITPPSNNSPASHRLSYVNAADADLNYPGGYNNKFWGLSTWGFGWLHESLTLENTILSDKTTQIPAVKGYHVDHGATVVRGPGSTGGDLVRLPAYNQEWTQLRIMVQP
ncbi:insecticidal delta-endotoxin Cry8Ea1 family protein, partial [Bacillus thuringiensis]|uniref:insecticidal delta-endotoxin Cry8Ea1 family protein n=1 Tax=Bacillus thuringiensis TaxID=1428 RepID=UPI003EBB4E38